MVTTRNVKWQSGLTARQVLQVTKATTVNPGMTREECNAALDRTRWELFPLCKHGYANDCDFCDLYV